MDVTELTNAIAVIAGVLTSIAFDRVPGLRAWFDTLSREARGAVMMAFAGVAAALIVTASCLGLDATVACTRTGVYQTVIAFGTFLAANQGTYLAVVRPRQSNGVGGGEDAGAD